MLYNVGMTYQTKKLTTGNYSWRWRYHGDERVLPCLVERKRAGKPSKSIALMLVCGPLFVFYK